MRAAVLRERVTTWEVAMISSSEAESVAARSPEYEGARKRVEKKRKFKGDVVAYVVINAFLIGVWAVTGLGYFWPGWILAGWGCARPVLGWWAIAERRTRSVYGATATVTALRLEASSVQPPESANPREFLGSAVLM